MLETIPQYISARLKHRNFSSDDEIYLYLLSIVATAFCLTVHLYLMVMFAVFGEWTVALINLGSVGIYLIVFTLVPQRKYTIIGAGISLEVTLYATLVSFLIGINSYTLGYFLLVIIMQFIIPYGKPKGRAAVVGLIFFCTAACIAADMFLQPPLPISPVLVRILMISNVFILMIGTIVELYIGNVVKQIIEHMNEERMEKLTSEANTDALTGLFNRRYADLAFQRIKEKDTEYLVAMIDIDDFKKVNDTYGHAVGDEVLQFLANFLRVHLRKSDFVFRWGGEEFVVLLANVSPENGFKVLDNLRRELGSSVIGTVAGDLQITVTIGGAKLDRQNPMESVDRSDKNMYIGKKNGKNQVVL